MIDLNENEHPFENTVVAFLARGYYREEVDRVVDIHGEFTAAELRDIADFMDNKAIYKQPEPS